MGNSASTIASTLVTKDEAQAKYQPKGSYLTPTAAASTYLASTDAKATYLASADAKNTYLASADAKATYLATADAPTKTLWCANGSCKIPSGSNSVLFPSRHSSTLGKPTATGTPGARVVMWGDGSQYFYGAGMDTNTLWMSTDTPNGIFKFYNQDKEVANISSAGVSAPTFTASGSVITPQLTASGTVTAGTVTATGAVNAGSVTTTGAINAGSVTTTGALSGATFTTTGDITTSSAVNAKDIVASGSVSAPNMYDRAGVDAAINKATQNIVSSGQAANLANLDITPKSVNAQGQVSVPRGTILRLSGPSDPVHSIGFASAYGVPKVDGPFIAGWQGPSVEPYRGALGTIGNNNGNPTTPNVAMYWDAGANTTFPNRLNAREIRVGDWLIRQTGNGFLEFVRVNPDGSLVDGAKANVPYIAFTGDGNINLRRFAKDGDYGSGYLADQFVRYDRPFAIQSSRGDYLSNTDNFGAGFRGRPTALTNWETMVARKPFGLDFAPIADDKPFTDTKVLFKSTDPPKTAGGGSYGGAI